MLRMHRLPLLLLAACGLTAGARAQTPEKTVGLAVQAEMEYGGDAITAFNTSTGHSQSISAGEGMVVGAGGYLRPVEGSHFEIRGLVGYKFLSSAASNARLRLTRIVRQVTGNWRFHNEFSVGAGVVQHSGLVLHGDDYFRDRDFRTSTGMATQVGWRFATLQYTNMRYVDKVGNDFDASTVGVALTWRL